jgi:tRNA threonylcarbamoyl adenosine modification protein YjeE
MTAKIGRMLARGLYGGLLVLLSGGLGSGKTLLVRAMGMELGVDGVKSPTFAIESVHCLPDGSEKKFRFVHADLYRLEDTSETVIQLDEHIEEGDVVLVEWGERWSAPRREDRWDVLVKTEAGAGEDDREIILTAHGERAIRELSDSYVMILDSIADGALRRCR